MKNQFISVETGLGVCGITLDRPDVLNSFNREMALELQEALAHVRESDDVRVVLLAGVGRGFCAGQDLNACLPDEDGNWPDLGVFIREQYNPIIRGIREIEKPFICAVNGVAAGAGANLALACDFVLAASNAIFVQAFSAIGLIPDSGGTFMLPRLVGMAKATELTMLGEKVSAQDALEMGLIYKTCADTDLNDEALKFAQTLAKKATRGLGLTKRALNESLSNDLATQLDLEEELQREAGATEDYREGVNAFLEKRKPRFQGR